MKDYMYLGIICALCIVALIFIVRDCNHEVGDEHPYYPPTVYVDTGKTIYRDSIVYKRLPAKLCTVYVEPDAPLMFTAEVDTIIDGDSIEVVYNFPPNNYFDIYLSHRVPDTVFAQVTKTVAVLVDKPINFWGQIKGLYGNGRAGFGAGLGYGSVGLGINQMFEPSEQIFELSYRFNF